MSCVGSGLRLTPISSGGKIDGAHVNPDIACMKKGIPRNADLACQYALDRLAKVGFDALTEKEKTLATVWKVEAGVENGGFLRYFSSAAGDVAFHGPAAFEHIGARHLAELATKANAVFGPEGPPRDRATRSELVRAFSDETRQTLEALDNEFLESSDDTDPLIDTYLARP